MIREQLLVLIVTAAANLGLGFAVWSRAPSKRVNQYFGAFSFAVGAWTLSNALVNLYAADPSGVIWARTAFASASLIPLAFLSFVGVFPSSDTSPPRGVIMAFLISGLTIFGLAFTPLVARSTSSVNNVLQVSYGPLHPVFGLFFLSTFAYALFFLATKLRRLRGLEHLQVRYVFLAVSLAACGATTTNLIIPLLLGSSRFSAYGPVFSILMMAMIAHSIIRHRLLDIRVVIRRSVTYLISVAVAGVIFVVAWKLSASALPLPTTLPSFQQLLLALLVALLFQPLKRFIQRLIDSYVFRRPYDYQRTIRDASRTLAGILDLPALLDHVCSLIDKTIRPESVKVYTSNHRGSNYRLMHMRRGMATQARATDTTPSLSATAPLPTLLSERRAPIVRDDLSLIVTDIPVQELHADFERLRGEFALPILQEDRLVGFFLVGPKLSGDPYFADDIDLLSTIVSQASIAFQNAQLYSQVLLGNEYLENLLATIDSAVVAVSADGVVTHFNSAAARLTGLSTLKARGTSLNELPATVAGLLAATLEDSRPRIQLETIILNSNGQLSPVICSTAPLKHQTGSLLGAVVVFSDLTRVKQLEEQQRQTERLASIGALASGIAHEVKNPLVAIKTFAELLPERFTDDDFRNDFSKVVIREIDRIDHLVGRLKGLAMPVAHSDAPVDVRAPVEETLALLRGQLEQTKIRVTLDSHPGVPMVVGDAAQLKQLFLNLFVNAIEAMTDGGALSVTISSRGPVGNRKVVVDVTDTGPGIPEGMIGKIFEPFVTTKVRGSGLGLYICRGIADAHRATIRAANRKGGQGTALSVEFPAFDGLQPSVVTG